MPATKYENDTKQSADAFVIEAFNRTWKELKMEEADLLDEEPKTEEENENDR